MVRKYKRNYEKEKIAHKIYILNNKEKIAAAKKDWRQRNPEKVKAQKRRSWHRNKHKIDRRERCKRNRLKKHYGITLELFNEYLSKNENKCACCKREFNAKRFPHVDHCHKTGIFRGIICVRCNIVEGYLRENPSIFSQLQKYLEERNYEFPKSNN